MRALLQKRVSIAWLLLIAIVCGAAVIVAKVAIFDAPPAGSVFIVGGQGDNPSATITPFGNGAGAGAGATSGAPRGINGGATATASGGGPLGTLFNPAPTEIASSSDAVQGSSSSDQASPTVPMIAVYVSGGVAHPGVYEVPEGSRNNNAVEAAGGANPDADLEQINLAQRVADGDHITAYRKGEVAPTAAAAGGGDATPADLATALPGTPAAVRTSAPVTTPAQAGAAKATPGAKINLNTATAADLEQLPGIGPSLAQRIIIDRAKNGPFKSIDDLARISGIKSGIIARIRDFVTVGP